MTAGPLALTRLLALATVSVQPPTQPRPAQLATVTNPPIQDLELNFSHQGADRRM